MAKRWNIILPIVVLVIVGVIVFIKRDDLGSFVEVIKDVSIVPFILAACCLFGRYFSHAYAYKAVFRCVDEEVKYLHIVPLVFSVTFANDCAPTAGTAGSVLIAAWSHKQGLDMGKSVTVVFLEKIGYFGGFAVVMLIGFAILIFTGQMVWYLALGGLAVLLMIFTFGFVMWLGYSHVETEQRLFAWIENLVNRALVVFKRKPAEPWAARIAASFHEAASIAVDKPRALIVMFCRMVLLHACDCMCFIFVGFAFGYTYIPFLMASYVAGFIIATFILQTIGAVEILLALVLSAYGATPAQAAAIALAYRGLIFWIPFVIGAICINITGQQKQVFAQGSEEVLVKGGDENAAQAKLEAAPEAPVIEDMSEMLPVPPAAWTREQEHAQHEVYAVSLADIVNAFQGEDLVRYNTGDQNAVGEYETTQIDQDDIIAGQTEDTNDDETYPVPPQGGSGTSLTEIFMSANAVQEDTRMADVDTVILDTAEETGEEAEKER